MGGEEMSTLGGNGVGQKWGEEGDGTKGKKSVGRESRVERKGSEKGEGTGSEENGIEDGGWGERRKGK